MPGVGDQLLGDIDAGPLPPVPLATASVLSL